MLEQIKGADKLNEVEKERLTTFFNGYEENYEVLNFTKELAVNTFNLVGAKKMIYITNVGGLTAVEHSKDVAEYVENNFDAIVKFAETVRDRETGEDSLPMFFVANWETRHYLGPKSYQDVLDGVADEKTRALFDRAVTLTMINHCIDILTYSIIHD